VSVETFGTEAVPTADIERAIQRVFDLRPAAIIAALNLRRPIFEQTASYGHFGRTDLDLPWEQTSRAEELKQVATQSVAV
jgi:S-adenosylmethionine synthetase